jgi:hypothetical protein
MQNAKQEINKHNQINTKSRNSISNLPPFVVSIFWRRVENCKGLERQPILGIEFPLQTNEKLSHGVKEPPCVLFFVLWVDMV